MSSFLLYFVKKLSLKKLNYLIIPSQFDKNEAIANELRYYAQNTKQMKPLVYKPPLFFFWDNNDDTYIRND